MRKFRKLAIVLSIVATLLALSAAPVLAVKPSGNLAGAVKVAWNLSAAVAPVPPYGSLDIPGSDTASKLIVNQPNGNTEVAITGAMNGLNPNTEYTVYLSNGYEKNIMVNANVAGTWLINVEYLGKDYPETLILTQSGSDITGVSLDTVPPASLFDVIGGSVVGNVVTIHCQKGSLYTDLVGTIALDGSMSGNWFDVGPGTRTGEWATTSGTASYTMITGGWSQQFGNTVPFTFTTDEFGAGSWHINLRYADFDGPDTYKLSVWINVGGTLLISDNFTVDVD